MQRKTMKTSAAPKVVRNLPASESGHGIHYKAGDGREYCVSHCPPKERFTLWRIVSEGYIQLATRDRPGELLEIAHDDK